MMRAKRRIVVGISGASGSIYAIAALRALREASDWETHIVLSPQARQTIELETDTTAADVEALADVVHRDGDLAASISSGSFKTEGMLVIPCSMRSASAIAYGQTDTLLVRAADVCLKEKRRVVLVVRETPLHLGHLRTLVQLAEIGAVILPPVPGMYARPRIRGRHRRAHGGQSARSVRHRREAVHALERRVALSTTSA